MADTKDDIETIISRSIGRTCKVENHIERAKDVIRSLAESDYSLPQPTSIADNDAEIARLQAKVAELEKNVVAVRKSWSDFADNVRQKELADMTADRDSLRAKLERAKEALLPFSEAEPQLDDDFRDVSDIWEHSSAMSITGGDIRRARAVLAELSADAPAQQTPDLAAIQERNLP